MRPKSTLDDQAGLVEDHESRNCGATGNEFAQERDNYATLAASKGDFKVTSATGGGIMLPKNG